MKLGALLDSGASLSCLSRSAAKNFISKNIPYQKVNSVIKAAGGQKYKILGFVYTDITFKNITKSNQIFIIPDLKQDTYLGINFWKAFSLFDRLFDNCKISEIKSSTFSDNINGRTKAQTRICYPIVS